MASESHPFPQKLPTFQERTNFLAPQISNLIQDPNFLCEDGIAYLGYRRCNPIDAQEVFKSGGRSLNFLFQVIDLISRPIIYCSLPKAFFFWSYIFKEPSAFVNPRRMFLDIDFVAINDAATTPNKALTHEDWTSCVNPIGQGMCLCFLSKNLPFYRTLTPIRAAAHFCRKQSKVTTGQIMPFDTWFPSVF